MLCVLPMLLLPADMKDYLDTLNAPGHHAEVVITTEATSNNTHTTTTLTTTKSSADQLRTVSVFFSVFISLRRLFVR